MLSLQVKSGEYITIGEDIVIQIFEQSGSNFKVSIQAPREIPILRGAVRERAGSRPEGLHDKRPKSPSQRRYSAKRFEQWVERREQRESEQQEQ